jgi:hypothetical protein
MKVKFNLQFKYEVDTLERSLWPIEQDPRKINHKIWTVYFLWISNSIQKNMSLTLSYFLHKPWANPKENIALERQIRISDRTKEICSIFIVLFLFLSVDLLSIVRDLVEFKLRIIIARYFGINWRSKFF